MVTITVTKVSGRGKRGSTYVFENVDTNMTVTQFKAELQKKSKLNMYRQGLKKNTDDPKKPIRLNNWGKTLAGYGITQDCELEVKDMGPQFSYRGVFVIEYLGPILIVLGYALRPSFLYGPNDGKFDSVAQLGMLCWVLHFLKRELETFFVHRFSRPTMPLMNLFKNSAYYWGFAFVVGYVLCHPDYTAPTSSTQIALGCALMAVSEIVNLCVHLQLRGMRKKEGSDERPIPGGPLFSLVSCPNYTAEVLGWVGFSIMTNILGAWFFTLVGFAQMSQWALGKHGGYIKQDPGYKKRGRKAIVPFLL